MRSLLAGMGGAGLLSRRAFLLLVPSSLLTSVFLVADFSDPGRWLRWLAANVMALLACWAWFELFERRIFATRLVRRVSLPSILAFGFALGAIKGGLTGAGGWLLGVETDLGFAVGSRIVQAGLLGAALVPLLDLLVTAQRRFTAERDLLLGDRVRATPRAALAAADLAALHEFGDQARKTLALGSPDSAAAVRTVIDTQLRPLSHRLWKQTSDDIPAFTLTSLLRLALLDGPFASPVMVALYLLAELPFVAARHGLLDGLGRMAVTSVVLGCGYVVARRVTIRSVGWAAAYFVGVNAAISVAIVSVGNQLGGGLPTFSEYGSMVALFASVTTLSLVVAAIRAAWGTHRNVARQLEAVYGAAGIDEAVLQVQARRSRRDLAHHLHSSVQNRLLSAALRIDAVDGDDVAALAAQIRSVEAIVDSVAHGPGRARGAGMPLACGMDELSARWAGLVAVTWTLSDTIPDQVRAGSELMIQVCDEAVTNASRHGLATAVHITVDIGEDGRAALTVDDDGLGPRNGSVGLGSDLFSAAGTDWALVQRPDGGSRVQISGIPGW